MMATHFTRNLISTRLVRAAQGCHAAPLPICHHRSYLLTSRLLVSTRLPQAGSCCFHQHAAEEEKAVDCCPEVHDAVSNSGGDCCPPCCFTSRVRCCALPLLQRHALLMPSPGVICCTKRRFSSLKKTSGGTPGDESSIDGISAGSGPWKENTDDVSWRGKIVSWLDGVKERFSASGAPFSTAYRRGRQEAGASSRRNVVPFDEVKRVSEKGAKDTLIIDVRNPDEFGDGHIPNSHLLPLPELERALKLDKVAFEKEFKFQLPDQKQNIIISCKSGKRAETARKILKKKGYQNLKVYRGSWDDWTVKGALVEK